MSINKDFQLREVQGIVQNCKNLMHYEIMDRMSDSGWEVAGEGYFSIVYKHEQYPDLVIKVCHREADSWPFYAKYCMDNVDNEEVNFLLPVIHSFHKIRSRGLYVAVLDKLHEGSECNLLMQSKLNALGVNLGAVGAVLIGFNAVGSARELDLPKHCIYKQPDYYMAAQRINDELSTFCSIDLHGGNIMFTADGKIVVTDPVSFSSQSKNVDWGTDKPVARSRACTHKFDRVEFMLMDTPAVRKGRTKGQQSTFIRKKVGHFA